MVNCKAIILTGRADVIVARASVIGDWFQTSTLCFQLWQSGGEAAHCPGLASESGSC